MLSVSNGLKTAAIAALVAFGAPATRPAHADTYGTRCDSDSDRCYAVRCNDDGDDCLRVSDYHYTGMPPRVYRYRSSYLCDSDGDNCRWVRERITTDDDDD